MLAEGVMYASDQFANAMDNGNELVISDLVNIYYKDEDKAQDTDSKSSNSGDVNSADKSERLPAPTSKDESYYEDLTMVSPNSARFKEAIETVHFSRKNQDILFQLKEDAVQQFVKKSQAQTRRYYARTSCGRENEDIRQYHMTAVNVNTPFAQYKRRCTEGTYYDYDDRNGKPDEENYYKEAGIYNEAKNEHPVTSWLYQRSVQDSMEKNCGGWGMTDKKSFQVSTC